MLSWLYVHRCLFGAVMALSRKLTSLGHWLNDADSGFSWCRRSDDLLADPVSLRQRLEDDGFVYIPGYLDEPLVGEAREVLLQQLDELGLVDRSRPVSEGLARQPWEGRSCHDLAAQNAPLQSLLSSGKMVALYELLFGEAVRCLDFTWLRVIGPGSGTAPHCDAVYMGRGTRRLYTSWTPLMEITPDVGGLTIMPGSHRIPSLADYRAGDVDTVCTNQPAGVPQDVHGWTGPIGDGKLSDNPAALRSELGLPWVTSECYCPGDVVVFSIDTIHGSLDNGTDRIRLSTDTRYQRAAEPVDERWVGADPPGHGPQSRRGMIC